MAIAYDNSGAKAVGSASSDSFSYTSTGSDLLMIINIQTLNNVSISALTYNSVSATQIIAPTNSGYGRYMSTHILVAPATGANTLAVTFSGASGGHSIETSTYTGCLQSSQPNASNSGSGTTSGLTVSVTTTLNNCWLVGWFTNSITSSSVGAGTYLRNGALNNPLIDSNGAKSPAGSHSLVLTGGSDVVYMQMVAIAPSISLGSGFFNFF